MVFASGSPYGACGLGATATLLFRLPSPYENGPSPRRRNEEARPFPKTGRTGQPHLVVT